LRDPPIPSPSDEPPSEPERPAASARRTRRCSPVAALRLAASPGSSPAAALQRSTPPAASSLDTPATRCLQVTYCVVGKGPPADVYGSCSVTAGHPNGHRTTTRRNSRAS